MSTRLSLTFRNRLMRILGSWDTPQMEEHIRDRRSVLLMPLSNVLYEIESVVEPVVEFKSGSIDEQIADMMRLDKPRR